MLELILKACSEKIEKIKKKVMEEHYELNVLSVKKAHLMRKSKSYFINSKKEQLIDVLVWQVN